MPWIIYNGRGEAIFFWLWFWLGRTGNPWIYYFILFSSSGEDKWEWRFCGSRMAACDERGLVGDGSGSRLLVPWQWKKTEGSSACVLPSFSRDVAGMCRLHELSGRSRRCMSMTWHKSLQEEACESSAQRREMLAEVEIISSPQSRAHTYERLQFCVGFFWGFCFL